MHLKMLEFGKQGIGLVLKVDLNCDNPAHTRQQFISVGVLRNFDGITIFNYIRLWGVCENII